MDTWLHSETKLATRSQSSSELPDARIWLAKLGITHELFTMLQFLFEVFSKFPNAIYNIYIIICIIIFPQHPYRHKNS